MPLNANKNSEKGQILLIVVLAAVISLTVGLSAVSRTITNTRVSTEEANSQKALSAAEAGVEEQINKAVITDQTLKPLSNNSSFVASAKPVDGFNVLINNGGAIKQDVGADVWLSDYSTLANPRTTKLTILWKATGDCTKDPAFEIAVISGSRTPPGPSMARYAVDSCSRGNNFDPPSVGVLPNPPEFAGQGFNRQFVLPASGPGSTIIDGYIARVIPLYADNVILGVASSVRLPSQGYIISSTGKSGTTVRQVRVYQGYPTLPVEFFPYNLFLP